MEEHFIEAQQILKASQQPTQEPFFKGSCLWERRHQPMRKSAGHILVIDGEAATRTLLRISLQKLGYTIRDAGTGQAALDLYTACDLVLVDVRLPDMNGFDLCIELRKRSQVPIVILTALNQVEDINQGVRVGADDYIVKPYRLFELALRLQAILQRKPLNISVNLGTSVIIPRLT